MKNLSNFNVKYLVLLLVTLSGCNAPATSNAFFSTDPVPTISVQPMPSATPSPSPSASPSVTPSPSPSASPSVSPSVTITVLANESLSGDPHLTDYYMPSNATRAVIFLHGGGGTKEGLANDLGVKSNSTKSTGTGAGVYSASTAGAKWLAANQVMLVFPQGQYLDQGISTTYSANSTWSNLEMDSGQNDKLFLQNLAANIRSNYPQITKLYLAGHSNGGMMANRMWCESPNTFDAFASLAGPPSPLLALSATGTDAAPCGSTLTQSTVMKPYLGVIGDHDTVLQTHTASGGSQLDANLWTIDPSLVNPAVWTQCQNNPGSCVGSNAVTPTVLNDFLFLNDRANLKCQSTLQSRSTVTSYLTQLTVSTACSGSIEEVLVEQNPTFAQGGDHCLGTGPYPFPSNVSNLPCVTSQPGLTTQGAAAPFDPKTLVFNFLKNY